MPNIISTYLKYVEDGKRKYGERTMVFLECGAFYEIYDTVPPEESSHLRCCRDQLGLLVTRKNKADPASPYMAGIPSHSIRRFNKLLLQHNYTIIFVTQKGEAPNITREVTKVLSPGCSFSEEVHESTDAGQSVLLSLLLETDDDGECYAHMASFDANCGKIQLSTVDCDTDTVTVDVMLATLQDKLHMHMFHELCVHYRSDSPAFSRQLTPFIRVWEDMGKQVHVFDVNIAQMDYMFNRGFQGQFLERTFTKYRSEFSSIWESLHLQFTEPSCVTVLVMLLHWIRLHDARLITGLQIPQSHQTGVVHRGDTSNPASSHLAQAQQPTMTSFNDLYAKLNVFDDSPNQQPATRSSSSSGMASSASAAETRSLFALINRTRTKMGERLLRDRLVHVTTECRVIEERLTLVDALLDGHTSSCPRDPTTTRHGPTPTDLVETPVEPTPPTRASPTFDLLGKSLKCIDLERMYRRFSVGNLQPHDVPRVIHSQQSVQAVLAHLATLEPDSPLHRLLPREPALRAFESYQRRLVELFDEEKCSSVNMASLSNTLFHKGQFPDVDKAVEKYEKQTASMQILADTLMALVPGIKLPKHTSTWINIKSNDKDGYWLDVTKARFQHLKKALDAMQTDESAATQFAKDTDFMWSADDLTFDTKNKSNVKISGTKMNNLSYLVLHEQQQLIQLVKDTYSQLLVELHDTYYSQAVQPVIECVAQLDVAFSTAAGALAHGYVRPVMVADTTTSSVDAEALRHPLIERLLVRLGKRAEYVPNDVRLSSESCWLLYGVNSVGKSSLLKSIAVGVLMAQAGLFVAARSFRLAPYHKIFARTGNDDNIHMAHSSFVKEITEVKHIVQNADAHSLVIADELCASTELDSAVDIVAALLQLLTTRKSTYAFATHLFALQEHPHVKSLLDGQGPLCNLHLHVRFEKGKLWFDRKLTPGLPSNRTYGTLVADKVIQSAEFSSLLEQVRNRQCAPRTPTVGINNGNAQPPHCTARARAQVVVVPCFSEVSSFQASTIPPTAPPTAHAHVNQSLTPIRPCTPQHHTRIVDPGSLSVRYSNCAQQQQQQHQQQHTRPDTHAHDAAHYRSHTLFSDFTGARDKALAPDRETCFTAASVTTNLPRRRRVARSRYNARHWNEECAVCKYKPTSTQHMPLDTHHIREQRTADQKTGLIDHRFHKNETHNLVTLCKPCHQSIDTGELVVDGYMTTSDGPELIWYRPG